MSYINSLGFVSANYLFEAIKFVSYKIVFVSLPNKKNDWFVWRLHIFLSHVFFYIQSVKKMGDIYQLWVYVAKHFENLKNIGFYI